MTGPAIASPLSTYVIFFLRCRYGYYSGFCGYWNKTYGDLGVYQDLTNGTELVTDEYELEQYMGHLLQDKVEDAMEYHVSEYGISTPFFLYYAPELVHDPYEAPEYYIDMCTTPSNDNFADNRIYCAMKIVFDEVLANTTCKMASLGLAHNSLLIVSTDNGGVKGIKGSNYPYRGWKGTVMQGGLYAGMAFIYGPAVPESARGTTYNGLMHITDWLPTLMHVVTDNSWTGPRSGYKLDGKDQWDAMMSDNTIPSPRNETLLNVDNVTNKESSIVWCVRLC